MINLRFDNIVRQLLPWYKRQRVRIVLLASFVSPLQSLFNAFIEWAAAIRRRVNITAQVGVLEGYLRAKYNRPISIKIETFDDGLVDVYLEAEGLEATLTLSLSSEGQLADIPLDGELRGEFGDVDFIVYIPADVDINEIRAEIERYRQAGVRYKIVQR